LPSGVSDHHRAKEAAGSVETATGGATGVAVVVVPAGGGETEVAADADSELAVGAARRRFRLSTTPLKHAGFG